jgi:hypothetical protein
MKSGFCACAITFQTSSTSCFIARYSSSSSGPGAYVPDVLQPIGLLCDPYPPVILDVPTPAAGHLHVHTTREILAAKGGTVGENVGR